MIYEGNVFSHLSYGNPTGQTNDVLYYESHIIKGRHDLSLLFAIFNS